MPPCVTTSASPVTTEIHPYINRRLRPCALNSHRKIGVVRINEVPIQFGRNHGNSSTKSNVLRNITLRFRGMYDSELIPSVYQDSVRTLLPSEFRTRLYPNSAGFPNRAKL